MKDEVDPHEVRRAARWVQRQRREKSEFRASVFRRINGHIAFLDHKRALQQYQRDLRGGSDGEDDGVHAGEELALDFLQDIEADDIKSLLASEATAPVAATTTTLAMAPPSSMEQPAVASTVVAPGTPLEPLRMPLHLASDTPVINGVSMTTRHVGEDTGVSALMEELNIDVQSFLPAHDSSKSDTAAETHAAGSDQREAAPPASVPLLAQTKTKTTIKTKSDHLRCEQPGAIGRSLGSDWLDAAPPKTSTVDYNPDSVTDEMFSWVDGERHPDVVKRKESLRQQRPQTTRYGTNTYKEQKSMRRIAKYYSRGSDESTSASSGDESNGKAAGDDDSDFDLGDADADVEDDPMSDVELLPDDYLTTSSTTGRRPRKRLQQRQRKARPRKVPAHGGGSRISVSTAPLGGVKAKPMSVQPLRSRKRAMLAVVAEEEEESEAQAKKNKGTRIELESGNDQAAGQETIDLRSDEDVQESETPKMSTVHEGKAQLGNKKESLVLKFKMPDSMREAHQHKDKFLPSPPVQHIEKKSKMKVSAEDKSMDGAAIIERGTSSTGDNPNRQERKPVRELTNDEADITGKETDKVTFSAATEEGSDFVTIPRNGNMDASENDLSYGGGIGFGVDFSDDQSSDAPSDTGTLDFEAEKRDDLSDYEEMDASHEVDKSGMSSDTLAPAVDDNGREQSPLNRASDQIEAESSSLQPVHPSVKMSPQPTTIQDSKDKSTSRDTAPTTNVDRSNFPTVDLTTSTGDVLEIVSEVDFGSSESDDFDGTVHQQPSDPARKFGEEDSAGANDPTVSQIDASQRVIGEDEDGDKDEETIMMTREDDEDTEFGQFFQKQQHAKPKHGAERSGANMRKDKQPAQSAQPPPKKPTEPASIKQSVQTQNTSVSATGRVIPAVPSSSSLKARTTDTAAATGPKPTPPIGSNGLRNVRPIKTTPVTKGKYTYSRRSIQFLDSSSEASNKPDTTQDPKQRLAMRSRFFAGPPPSALRSLANLTPLQTKETTVGSEGTNARYLGYATVNGGKLQSPRSSAARPTKREQMEKAAKLAKKQLGGPTNEEELVTPMDAGRQTAQQFLGMGDLTTSGRILEPKSTSAAIQESSEPRKETSSGYVPPRAPQLDLYDALGAQSQVTMSAFTSGGGGLTAHKRPTKFAKDVEEAKRQGVDVRKGVPEELDPRAPIPKKSHQRPQSETEGYKNRSSGSQANGAGTTQKSKKRKASTTVNSIPTQKKSGGKRPQQKRNGKANGSEAPSYYGPSSHSRGYESEAKSDNGRASRRRSRSRSPNFRSDNRRNSADSYKQNRSRGRGRGDSFDDGHRRGRDSGGGRGNTRDFDWRGDRRSRSRSRSGSRSRSHDRNYDRERGRERSRDRYHFDDDNSFALAHDEHEHYTSNQFEKLNSKTPAQFAPPSPEESGQVQATKLAKSNPETVQMSTRSASGVGVSGGVDNDIYIDDSDDDIALVDDKSALHSHDEIRFPLEDVEIDHELMKRMLYVTNIGPKGDEGDLEAEVANHGVAVDRETGFSAIEVFMCQRTLRPRGDARVTFVSEEAAIRAISELNAKICMNAKLSVRAMDPHTMRILHAQFNMIRDTWRCPSVSCRSDVSVWAMLCDQCGRNRMFSTSRARIQPGDWLCSMYVQKADTLVLTVKAGFCVLRRLTNFCCCCPPFPVVSQVTIIMCQSALAVSQSSQKREWMVRR